MEQEKVNVEQISEQITEKIIASWKPPKKLPDHPIVLFMAGFQGSGKSTLLGKVKDEFGLTVISLDDVRDILFQEYGFQRPVPPVFVEIVNSSRDKLVREAIKRGFSFALDTNMTPKRIEHVFQLFPENVLGKYKVVSVFLKAPVEELVRRVSKRPTKPGGYGGVDELYGSMLQHGEIDEKRYDLVIDTGSSTIEQAAQKIVEYITTKT